MFDEQTAVTFAPEAPAPGNAQVPQAGHLFRLPDGQEFVLDLISAIRATTVIAKECEGAEPFTHVDRWAGWVKQHSGVELTPDQADWLWDAVSLEYAAKKARTAARLAELQSPSSTGSTRFN